MLREEVLADSCFTRSLTIPSEIRNTNMSRDQNRLISQRSNTDFSEFIETSTVEEVSQFLQSKLCNADFTTILNRLLEAFSNAESSQAKKWKVVRTLLTNLATAKVTTQQADRILNRIIAELPNFSKLHLVKLVDFCITCIRDDEDHHLRCWKDLLPAILFALEKEKYIPQSNILFTGPDYKTHIVKSICEIKWNSDALPCLAEMFVEMALEKNDKSRVLESLCNALNDLVLSQVPPFTYHSIQLCKNQNSRYLLDALRKYFTSNYEKANSIEDPDSLDEFGTVSKQELQDTESTVLYHIYQAAQPNPEILKDYLKYKKNISSAPEYVLQTFPLSVLLSISDLYEEQVLELLRAVAIVSFQEDEKYRKSAWLRKIEHSHNDLTDVIGCVIENSNKDRHLVLKGLVALAFTLMDPEIKPKIHAISLWEIGAKVLKTLLHRRRETVETILQMLIEKIVGGGATMLYYTDCLAYSCSKLTMMVMDNQVWITTLLERLLLLPGELATQVLCAVFPLMRISTSIRENLILTLRKALYRKGVAEREMAITGFLEMLKYSKTHSNTSLSSHSSRSTGTSILTQATVERCSQMITPQEYDREACYEILDILKKCFTYECQVRAHLFKGFYGIATKNCQVTEIILEVLLSHLDCYLETDENILPPLRFDICTTTQGPNVITEEPIGELIFFLQKIYVESSTKDLTNLDKTLGILESLCKRMGDTNLEHFHLDDNIALFDDVIKSQRKLQNLKLGITVYEALMAFRIGMWNMNQDRNEINNISTLMDGYKRAAKFIKQCGKPKKDAKKKKDKDASNTTMKKGGKPYVIKMPETILDFDTIHKGLSVLYTLPDSLFEENEDFHHFLLQACSELLQRAKAENEKHTKSKKSNIHTYIAIAVILYEKSILGLQDMLENDEQGALLSLECFKELCEIICNNSNSHLRRFLSSMLNTRESPSRNINSQLQDVIFSLKECTNATLCNGDDGAGEVIIQKIPVMLIEIMELLASKIDYKNYNAEKIFDLAMKMAQTDNVRQSVAPVILQFLLHIEEYSREYGETLNELAIELCDLFGTIDEVAVDASRRYKILTENIAPRAYVVLCTFVKEKLENALWLLQRLKAEEHVICATAEIKEKHPEKLREKERSLCKQLSYVMQILHTLTNTAIEPGACTDSAVKNLLNLYSLLVNLTKYFNTKSSRQNAAFQATKFIQVVQLAGKPVRSAFYNLITHIEENQNNTRSKPDAYAQRNKVLKETKLIPRVVFMVEQFDKEVLLLSKKTGVPLENYLKTSITRDFRIKNPELTEGLEKMDVSALVTQNTAQERTDRRRSSSDESNEDSSSPKKSRTSTE